MLKNVEIFVECSRRSIGRYCSNNLQSLNDKLFDVYSPDQCLRLRFRSDSSSIGKGFEAYYSTISYSQGNKLTIACSFYRSFILQFVRSIDNNNYYMEDFLLWHPEIDCCLWHRTAELSSIEFLKSEMPPPPPLLPEMTCRFLIQVVFWKRKKRHHSATPFLSGAPHS